MMQVLEFFFQDFSHWIGGLVYIIVSVGSLGMALGLIAETFRGK